MPAIILLEFFLERTEKRCPLGQRKDVLRTDSEYPGDENSAAQPHVGLL